MGHAAPRRAPGFRAGGRGARLLRRALAGFALGLAGPAVAQPAPVDLGQVERVEVRYALVDVLVLDSRDRTVEGLSVRDFDLLVDGKPVPVVSLDATCAEGAVADPRGGRGPVDAGPAARATPLRIVHVFDYPHLEHPTETLVQAREALVRRGRETDEHAVAVFAPGLRIEAKPARGTREALGALERMEHDRTLYDGAYARLTERGFFRTLGTLLDVLETWPGAKVVLLYSGPFLVDGFHHDAAHQDVAGRAAQARVVLYTIDAAGMRAPRGFRYGDLGGPKTLARLAVETGGRFTYHTNDLGLGYARAQRDLACRYTLGFYADGADPDRPRRLTIRVLRPGARVLHPEAYAPRSIETRRAARRAGARAAPELFPRGGLAIEVEPEVPDEHDMFRVRLRLPPSWAGREGDGWTIDLRVLRRTGVVVHEVELPLAGGPGDVVDLGDVSGLPALPHRITVVVSRPDVDTPFATWLDLAVRRTGEGSAQGLVSDRP